MFRRLGAAALTLLAACTVTPSEVSPEADIAITGSVAGQDGRAVAGAPVTLVRHEGVAETFAAVVTLGVTCLDDGKQLSVCRSAKHADTGEDGRFAFTLKGSDTQGFLGDASMLEATAFLPRRDDHAAGPTATVRFLVQTERIALSLRAWEPAIEVVAAGRSGTVTWSELPAAIVPAGINATAAKTSVVFERAAGEPVWTTSGRNELASFDPRVLEDSKGSVSVAAEWPGQRVADDRGRTIELVLRSGRPGYRSRAGAPPSRGAVCAVRAPDGSLVTRSPCPLTDGAFDTPMGASPCEQGAACIRSDEVVVDRGGIRPVGLIVLRGCSAACKIESSTDGRAWTLAATTAAGDAAVNVIEGSSARFVRVISDDIESLREVSVWEPDGPARDPVSILADVGGGLFPPIEDAIRRNRRGAPIAAAALLLALIAGALIATALQRKAAAGR